MTQPPEYYERIIAGIRRGTGVELTAEFIAKAEEVVGKPFLEMSPADLGHANTVVQAETLARVAGEEQAIAWAQTISAAMKRRGAANIDALDHLLTEATDPDAAVELDALRSFAAYMSDGIELPERPE